MYVCMCTSQVRLIFVRCNVCQGRAYGDAVMRVRPLAARGKQARACRIVPDDIREHLPEELSNLPADLIFAANLLDHECSRSVPLRRIVEAIDRTNSQHRVQLGGAYVQIVQMPGWAVDTISSLAAAYWRAHKLQKHAMRWVLRRTWGHQGEGPRRRRRRNKGISVRARTH